MTYYEQLVKEMNRSMAAHPQSTVVMDYGSRKVVATGRDLQKMRRKIHAQKSADRVSIIFQKPKDNAVWVLARRRVS